MAVRRVITYQCLHCGRATGMAQRCAVCGGPPIVDTVELVAVEERLPKMPPSRVGRPPGSQTRVVHQQGVCPNCKERLTSDRVKSAVFCGDRCRSSFNGRVRKQGAAA